MYILSQVRIIMLPQKIYVREKVNNYSMMKLTVCYTTSNVLNEYW